MEHIYLIELQNNKYYIGRTTNFDKRMEQHQSCKDSAFTKKYTPSKTCISLMQTKKPLGEKPRIFWDV